MSHPLSADKTLEYAISQVRVRQFSERHAAVAAQNLIKIPGVMEVWSWGNLEGETHLSILLGVPNDVFRKYTTLLRQAPRFDEQGLCEYSILLVIHRIVTAGVLSPEAFWNAVEKTEETTGCQKLRDSMFIMLVPQRWKNPSNHKLLQTALCLPDTAFAQEMVTTARLIKQKITPVDNSETQ